MKKLLILFTAVSLSSAALATTNGLTEIWPIGNPGNTFVQAQLSGNATRPNGFTYSVPSGDYRGMFVVYQYEANGNNMDYPTAITYGGQSMTQAAFTSVLETNGATQKFLNIYIFFLNETGISNASGTTFSVTYSLTAANTSNNASYSFDIFTADEVLQTNPIEYCVAHQTGANLNTKDSITCAGTATFATGDLYLAVGGIGKVTNGPLHSNTGTTTLINQASNSMWDGIFYQTIQQTTSIKPYMVTNGGNAGRFILLASDIHSLGNPNNGGGNPLPVKLEGFTGKSNKTGTNSLYWHTATEVNLRNFEIERSSDGKNFKTIGTVATKALNGNSSYNQDYSFTDGAPVGKGYYRLKMVDNDGSVSYSATLVIDNGNITAAQLVVYPNPSNGVFTLGGVETTDNNQIKVLNSFGQSVGYSVVSTEVAAQTKTVRLNSPVPGFYYVTYESNGQVLSTKVFVK